MKIDGMTLGADLASVPDEARTAEARGYDGWFTGETSHDPFLTMGLAAEHTDSMEIGTAIAVAFPRSPMHVAYTANDLHALSGGRFVLGLGSQIKPHIEKRFSATWSHPAPRMREFILALKAIWNAWNDDAKLDFRGDFYTHTLMTPFFSPGPNPHGRPAVYLAAVGPKMTEVAGEVADGFLAHGFTTERYLREHTLPNLERGARKAGRDVSEVAVSLPVFVVTGRDEAERANVEQGVKAQIAFYGSTPAYRAVLEAHGWGDLQDELNALSKQGQWGEMGGLIDDEILDAFAVQGEPGEIGGLIRARYGDVVDRVSLYTGFQYDDAQWEQFLSGLRG